MAPNPLWRIPGKPYTIAVKGVTITCKPMNEERRAELISRIQSVSQSDGEKDFIRTLRDILREEIVSFDDADLADATPEEVISAQTSPMVADIWKRILAGNKLDEDEEGN